MSEKGCSSNDCEAHLFMIELVRELKQINEKITEKQQNLDKAIVKITENINELTRTNERLDQIIEFQKLKDKEQDRAIEEHMAFVNKALGALTTLTCFLPIGLFLLGIILKK